MSDAAYQLSDDIFNIANDDNLNEVERSEKIAEAIEAALAEREAQAVQREREAAKGLVEVLENIAAYYDDEMGRAVIPDWVEKKRLMENYHEIISKANAALDTYNDNRKG